MKTPLITARQPKPLSCWNKQQSNEMNWLKPINKQRIDQMKTIKLVCVVLAVLQFGCSSTEESLKTASYDSTQAASESQNANKSEQAGPYVILKLDDLKYDKNNVVDPGWTQVMDYLNEQNIVGTIGIIGNSLTKDTPEYFEWIKQRQSEGHELWHHGYCHCRWEENGEKVREFQGSQLATQQQYLLDTQRLAKEKLGITFRTFGAPYNATDKHTAAILEKMDDIKVWLFKDTNYRSSKYVFPRIRQVNIEYPVHVPDFKKLKSGFNKNRDEDVLVIQGHPRSWVKDPSRFEEFKKIVSYLKDENVTFTTPYDYYMAQQQ